MSAPNPDALTNLIARIVDTLANGVEVGEGRPIWQGGTWRRESVDQAYRWLHAVAYSQRAGGEATSTLCSKCDGTGFTLPPRCSDGTRDGHVYEPSGCVHCGFSGKHESVPCRQCEPRITSDPTGDAFIIQSELRSKLDEVGRLLQSALDSVLGAVSGIQAAVGVIDRGVSRELPHERTIPRTATKAEVSAAREAQGRRVARGEGFGAA